MCTRCQRSQLCESIDLVGVSINKARIDRVGDGRSWHSTLYSDLTHGQFLQAQGDTKRALAMDAEHLKLSLHEAQWEVPVPQPSTLNHQPSTLNHQTSTLNPQPSTINPQPSTLNPQPSTLKPIADPSTLNAAGGGLSGVNGKGHARGPCRARRRLDGMHRAYLTQSGCSRFT